MIGCGSILLLAMIGMAWGGCRRNQSCGKRGGLGWKLLGIAAVIGGLALFSHRASYRVHLDGWDDEGETASEAGEELSRAEHVTPRFVGVLRDRELPLRDDHVAMPKWVLICLATVLVISGSLLAGRERTRPFALRAFTALGLAAATFALVSFFSAPPRYSNNHDRIVKVAVAPEAPLPPNIESPRVTPQPPDDSADREPSRRTHRAKRPSLRRDRPGAKQQVPLQLPPRAGEIPVSAELAKETASASDTVVANQAVSANETVLNSQPISTDEAAKPDVAQPPAASAAPAAPPDAPAAPAQVDEPAASSASTAAPQAVTPQAAAPQTLPPSLEPAAPDSRESSSEQPPEPRFVYSTQVSAAARPDWVETPGKLVGSVYRVSVKSGLYAEVPECQRALDEAIRHEADHYIDELLGHAGASQAVNVPRSYLMAHVKHEEFAEIKDSASVGPMHQIHALLEFDDDVRADVHTRWREAIVSSRLWYAGSAAALVLALLATLYGYLKLDLRTGGAHHGRLQLAAALVTLIVAAGALLMRWAVPF